MSIKIVINPDFYEVDANGQIVGWSNTSPFKKAFPEYHKFVLTIGKSSGVVVKSNADITNATFGGSRSIVVNHIGAEISDAMFHTLVNNVNQYDYVVMILDFMSRLPEPYIKVYHDGTELTAKEVSEFKL